jgi:hypothetical protein
VEITDGDSCRPNWPGSFQTFQLTGISLLGVRMIGPGGLMPLMGLISEIADIGAVVEACPDSWSMDIWSTDFWSTDSLFDGQLVDGHLVDGQLVEWTMGRPGPGKEVRKTAMN